MNNAVEKRFTLITINPLIRTKQGRIRILSPAIHLITQNRRLHITFAQNAALLGKGAISSPGMLVIFSFHLRTQRHFIYPCVIARIASRERKSWAKGRSIIAEKKTSAKPKEDRASSRKVWGSMVSESGNRGLQTTTQETVSNSHTMRFWKDVVTVICWD